MKKRMLSILLCLCLCMGFLSAGAYAADEPPTGGGKIPDQEVSAPCDQLNVFEFNITELAKANGYTLRNVDKIMWDANIGIISQHTITGVGNENQTIKLNCRQFDEPRSDYVRVDVTLDTDATYFYIHIVLTGKYIVNISGITAANAMWDGSPKTGYIGTPVYTLTSGEAYEGNDIELTYTDAEGNPLTGAPVEVGKYYAVFAVPETNPDYKGGIRLPFQIFSPDDGEAVYQAEAGGEWVETTFTDAVAKVYEGGTVKLLRDVSVDGSTVMINKDMAIVSADGETPCVITTQTDGHGYLFRIGADVRLENVIVDGGSAAGLTATRALIAVGDTAGTSGKLTLASGSIVRNNNNTTKNGAGGGVCLISGECVINGGRITGNSANSGGGLVMTGTDNLTASLISGSVDNNKATGLDYGRGRGGGIRVNGGSFTMSGGKIYGNQVIGQFGYGGGVMLMDGSVTVSGGEIYDNDAEVHGGGIYVNGNSFTMYGGEIYGNTAAKCGGALYAANATVEMQNGTVTGNRAAYGGAMYINPSVTFELTGGMITQNTATDYAGGIELAPAATVKISGSPVVKGNTSSEENDGGMYFDYAGNIGCPSVSVGKMAADADVHWYTWMQENLSDMENNRLLIAAPAEGREAITAYDLSKMRYNDENYDLVLIEGDMYLVVRVPATDITVTPETLEIKVGDSRTLTAVMKPQNATCPITWSSSDESIASVDNGVVTALKQGTVTITATAMEGVSDTCRVTVVTPSTSENPPDTSPGITTGSVVLTKVDAKENNTRLPGVEFELYRENGTKIGTYTTKANGTITVWDITPGEYYWVEIRPAEGYLLDGTKHSFKVQADNITRLTVENTRSGVPAVFSDDHYAYIIGSEGLVRPEANITRAEVATIFFRLLDEETRERYMTNENSFSDVNGGEWYNTAVSTMEAMGIVNGRPGGIFAPNENITRGEFAAIAARFDVSGNISDASFADIYGHWAEKEINIAANNGWVLGCEEGMFCPDRSITRAEAMTMVNRVLQRIPEHPDDLLDDMTVWPDNADTSKWYYLMVQEASNSHDYSRKENGCEYWTGFRQAPDWAELEK